MTGRIHRACKQHRSQMQVSEREGKNGSAINSIKKEESGVVKDEVVL